MSGHVCRDRDGAPRVDDDGRPVRPLVVTCGGCGLQWCERCDAAPGPLCHACHGRGYSTAPLNRRGRALLGAHRRAERARWAK